MDRLSKTLSTPALAALRGPTSKGKGEGRGRDGREGEGKGGERGEGSRREGSAVEKNPYFKACHTTTLNTENKHSILKSQRW